MPVLQFLNEIFHKPIYQVYELQYFIVPPTACNVV